VVDDGLDVTGDEVGHAGIACRISVLCGLAVPSGILATTLYVSFSL
jgi:hypothetical protein